ncbi:MAG: dTDP-4-dehydrorhamnose 3,5-epimerase [Rhodopseudomonas sp.]|nr:dTDP-4-dehydrorhamnose 3,5-epimerase [Rhodopseudomonas sp.]
MKFEALAIPDVVLVLPGRIVDDRGYFSEVFRADLFRKNVADVAFVQHNQSLSRHVGTIRGLHFQMPPAAQGKLIGCLRGAILDVAVDIRPASPTFGRHVAVELNSRSGAQLWIPEGFAHGFCTLEADTEVGYLVTSYYSPQHDRGLRWNDPALAIDWPVSEADAVLSPKDAIQPYLSALADDVAKFA